MKNKSKNFFKKVIVSELFVATIGMIIVVSISLPMSKKILKQYSAKKEIESYQEKYIEMQEKNLELKKMVEYLESDQFIEEQARLKLDLKKEGENVAVIKNENSDESESESFNKLYDIDMINDVVTDDFISNPKKWLNYFLN